MPREPQTDRQYAYLSIRGRGASSHITETLGCEPDQEWSEGDPWETKAQVKMKVRRFMSWKLNSGLPDTEDLNAHVGSLLRSIRPFEVELQRLTNDFQVRIVMVSFHRGNFSFELDFEHQRKMTQLGLTFWIDAYADTDVHDVMFKLRSKLGDDIFHEE